MRFRFACLLLALVPFACVADDEEQSPLALSYVLTKDMCLVYLDPTLTYLEPHAVRTFANSMAWQKRTFGWIPYEPVTVLLKDFSDYGNASAGASPRNALTFDIAPLSLTFETYPASERMYSLMNHELTHVATMDMYSSQDLAWRHFFAGKVYPDARNPESMAYGYLTTPRFMVPRWYLEGSATFMETWMGGGLGRAQGGYDEMVFRAMVRDDARFFDPLGLVSKGTRIDFQVGVNAYLYGTRFMTWLAYAYGPGKLVDWLKRDEGSKRNYADNFEHVYGKPLEAGWDEWIAFEHEFQKKNLEEVRKFPVTKHRELVPRSLGSVSRAYYDESTNTLYGAYRYPGTVEHIGALSLKDGTVERLGDVKGAMLYKVTSLAYDPDAKILFYTSDNYALRDIRALDAKTGEERMLLEDARIGEIVFNRKDRSLWGVRHSNGLATLVQIPYPYTEWRQVHTYPYGVEAYDLDISPDGKLLSASMGEVNGDQFLRVFEIDKLQAGDLKPRSEYKFGGSVPEGFNFSHDGKYLYGSSYYTGVSNIFRYEVATGEIEAVSNAESGYFRPVELGDGTLAVFHYTGQGFVPVVIDPKPLKDVSAITFLGTALVDKYPVIKTWQVPPPNNVDDEKLVIKKGPYIPLKTLGSGERLSRAPGLQELRGRGLPRELHRPAAPGQDRPHRRVHAHRQPARHRTRPLRSEVSLPRLDRVGFVQPLRLLRHLRSHQALPQRLCGRARLRPLPHLRRAAPPRGEGRACVLLQARRAALIPERADHHGPPCDGRDRPVLHVRAQVAGRRGRREGTHLERRRERAGCRRQDLPGDPRPAWTSAFPLPVRQLVPLWIRNAAGASHGDRSSPFANFFLGAFGNNYVDSRSIKRYREWYAFPGFDIDEINGKSFARTMVEVNAPLPTLSNPWARRRSTPQLHAASRGVRLRAHHHDPNDSQYRIRSTTNIGTQVDDTQVQRAALVRHDALGRLCRGLQGEPSRRRRVDALPQDHVGRPCCSPSS